MKGMLTYNSELDELEYVTEDCTVIVEQSDGPISMLRKNNTDKIVGFKITNYLKEKTKCTM